MFGLMWTLIILFANLGDFALIIFQRYFGFVLTRLFYGGAQTAGFALIGMYQKSPYNVLIGEALLCFSATRSFSQNIQAGDLYFENGTRRLSVFGAGIAMFGTMIFLFAKKLEESSLFLIPDFFLLLSCATAIIHIRTLFLLPKNGFPTSVTHKDNVFNSSFVGQILAKRKISPEIKEEKSIPSDLSAAGPEMTLKESLKEYFMIMITRRFLLFTGMFLILMIRHQSAWSQLNAWLDFTYSDLDASCENQTSINSSDCFIDEYKSSIIDSAGMLKLLHPVVSLFMYGLLRFLLKKEEKKENPSETRPMVICLIVYLVVAMAIFACKTLISPMKSGDNTALGFAMVFSMTIYQQLIRAIPNVVS